MMTNNDLLLIINKISEYLYSDDGDFKCLNEDADNYIIDEIYRILNS